MQELIEYESNTKWNVLIVLHPVNSKVVFFTIVHCMGARRVSSTNEMDHSSKLTSLILADPHVSPGQINR